MFARNVTRFAAEIQNPQTVVRTLTMKNGGKLVASASKAMKDGTAGYFGYELDGKVEGGAYQGLKFAGFKYGIKSGLEGTFNGRIDGEGFGACEVHGKVLPHNKGYKFWCRVVEGPHANKFFNGYIVGEWGVLRAQLGEGYPEFEALTSGAFTERTFKPRSAAAATMGAVKPEEDAAAPAAGGKVKAMNA
eukprot:TRINITY_DN6312_c0_g6_i1.p1 TRINITY_DN6312_c0_g6~~TRINITY_DN6312_c0_g6_i1.p1  ORF type:complete len:190 (+),score=82.33 TRINITY_DN6312_c0_g6_i1:61-630(+)